MLTDCSSIQGSTASSSSDVMTLATTSSWCAMSIPSSAAAAAAVASTRLRILRLVRPHARRILVTPDTSPSFGFTVRGGKEFGTGFFISSVERNSEAELKGMRIGDQILRINGFRVDDAVHKELIQFITNQDRITMKVRSVGMLPIKDKDTDKLSWHAVKTFTNGSSASSESSYKVIPERETRNKEVNITLDVAPRTKLGLGICKGPEWKPGIFVQFTKEKSVAREAGLRQGDQILSVNSIDFSDVLFSEAVAVMKSASKLEMIVRKAAGCDLFPGESSGYNSSASSVTGDQSPCWADAKSKRLTAVCEETTTTAPIWNESSGAATAYTEQQRRADQQQHGCNKHNRDAPEKKPVGSQQQVNKTIIKLSEQGTSINNTFVSSTQPVAHGSRLTSEYGIPRSVNTIGSQEVLPLPPPMAAMTANGSSYATREERETRTVTVEVHRQQAEEAKRQQQQQQKQMQQLQQQRVEFNSHYRHNTLQPTHSLPSHTTPTKHPEFQKCLRNNSTQQQQSQQPQQFQPTQQQSAQNYRNTRPAVDSSSLSSAITEELKKRKEKQQRINAATATNNNNSDGNNNNSSSSAHSQGNYININGKQQNHYSQCRQQSPQQQQQQLHHHNTVHQQPLALKSQQQQQSHCHTTPLSPSSSSLSLSAPPTSPTNSSAPAPISGSNAATAALSARAVSNNVNGSERNNHSHSNNNNNNSSSQNIPTVGGSTIAGVGVGAGDQHSALMDEFKRAHQRMFKNGFQETERKERQEALRKTTMMEDDVNHRASRMFRNENGPTANGTQFQIPPPVSQIDPPQFASSPPRNQPAQYNTNNNSSNNNNNNNKFNTQQQQMQQKSNNNYNNGATTALKAPTEQPPKPPATPVPDYDNVEIRTKATTISSSVRPSYGYASTNIVTNGRDASNENNNGTNNNNNGNRRTLRAGTITIGEYEQPQQRREPAKFDFVGSPRRSNGSATEANVDNLQTELQHTLTRSKLKKSAELLEHQSNCPLRSSYENYENVARKLHGVSINEVASTAPPPMRMSNGTGNGSTNGILKNGNRHSGGGGAGGTKHSDKTISFGN
ncbi:putative uncharacterized protein DDB_G0282129 isoform X1 [Zeugodacus cucurbitae]|uniref:putative uncharacterized protein DDB_G0282129 isoform X1 n=1 Tax=Zeugodacus cucurbitae TaxID=28588 RepID=UPI0023D9389E|nr:putative uncharacterized protein DDB_G0282129 isoform X1 [Zeugodacus cucurbitae]XP_054088176.1 putative uncharacterized protein DDB_G0282129 isoform X1 [Zeugodacus cucurbitae]